MLLNAKRTKNKLLEMLKENNRKSDLQQLLHPSGCSKIDSKNSGGSNSLPRVRETRRD